MNKSLKTLIEESQERQLIEDPVKPGYVRVYTDHTGRFYEDIPISQEESNYCDEFAAILREEIDKEILAEIKRKIGLVK